MKTVKISFFALIFFSFITYSSIAQITGGGVQEPTRQQEAAPKKRDVFKNTFNISLSIANPMGSFGGEISILENSKISLGEKIGLSGDIGITFMFKGLDLNADNLKLGLDMTFFGLRGFLPEETFMLNSGLGPILSFNPASRLRLEVKYTLQPTYLILYYDGHDANGDLNKFFLRQSLGVYLRLRPILFGLNLNWGNAKYDELKLHKDNTTITLRNKKAPTTCFDITFGFTF